MLEAGESAMIGCLSGAPKGQVTMGSVEKPFRIACVAPGTRMPRELAKRAEDLVFETYGSKVELEFHPQCFLTSGHFAGEDSARIRALADVATRQGDEAAARGWRLKG